LHSHLAADTEALTRFKREGVAIASLKHPNIVQVYGIGSWHEQPYISMEYLHGKSLSAVLKETGPLPAKRAVNIFVQICDAIGHAHEGGIIHRDLKPSNVMVFENDQVKLVDFGIAKILPDAGKDIQKLTQTGALFGTLAYMSPEQWMGKEVTRASDVFSLGCLMYEVLEGNPPLVGATAFETMHKRITESPDSTKLGELAPIILACLAQEPDQRPENTKLIKASLLDPESFHTNTKVKRAPSKLSRKTLLGASVIVFGITVIVTGVVIATHKVDEKPELNDFHIIGRTGQQLASKGDHAAAVPYLRKASELAKRHQQEYPGQNPRIQLQLQMNLAHSLMSEKQIDEAADLMKDVVARFPKHDESDAIYFDALDSLGSFYSSQHNPEAIKWRKELLNYVERKKRSDLHDLMQLRLAQSYCDTGQCLKAIPLLEPLLGRTKARGEDELYAAAMTHLGASYVLRSRLETGSVAQADFERGIKLLRKCLTLDTKDPQDPTTPSVDCARMLLTAYTGKNTEKEWNPKFRKSEQRRKPASALDTVDSSD
jgi:serine/threonine protein kinase